MKNPRATMPRRTFAWSVAGALAAAGYVRYPGDAAEFTYRLGCEWPPDFFMAQHWIQAAAKITNDSNGRLELRVFPNSALGGQSQMLSQVRLGAIEFNTALDIVLSDTVPVAGISSTPFIFSNQQDALKAFNGPLGKFRRDAIAAKLGVFPLPQSWSAGFRQITNSAHPINTPDDLKGLKMRTPGSALTTALFKIFGVIPTALSSNEEYTGMQTHLVDGGSSPLASVESHHLYEVQKYVAMTNYIWALYTVLVNGDAWQRLPKQLQDIVQHNAEIASAASNVDSARLDGPLEKQLTAQGMVFSHPNTAPFRAVIQKAGFYAQSRDAYGADAWALLERSVGKLA